MSCGECNVISLYCSVNGSVCLVWGVSDCVCVLLLIQFAIFLSVVVIYYECVECGWMCSVG